MHIFDGVTFMQIFDAICMYMHDVVFMHILDVAFMHILDVVFMHMYIYICYTHPPEPPTQTRSGRGY